MPVISRDELRTRIGEVPRVLLGHLPTPMDFCGRLTEAIGGPKIYVKRDDCTGLAFGGNKTRQLEFTIAQGLAQGADVLIGGRGRSPITAGSWRQHRQSWGWVARWSW